MTVRNHRSRISGFAGCRELSHIHLSPLLFVETGSLCKLLLYSECVHFRRRVVANASGYWWQAANKNNLPQFETLSTDWTRIYPSSGYGIAICRSTWP